MQNPDIWERIEPHLLEVERPSRYIDHEFGAIRNADPAWRCCLVYPDTYEIGQSNQGLSILYHALNADPEIACERAYLPWTDMAAIMRDEGIPLFSLETYSPLSSFDVVGITLPHELVATNVLETLSLSGIPLLSKERGENDPLVIGGGSVAYNPEPLAAFFDLFLIGEGEEQIVDFAREHRRLRDEGATRDEMLLALAQMPGTYVPRFYAQEDDGSICPMRPDVPAKILKRVVRGFDAYPADVHQIVPFAEITHDRLAIEILRGCSRGCRFCQAGMVYRPVRERSADTVVAAVCDGLAGSGFDEVSLTSLSSTDHSQAEEILRRLNQRLAGSGASISIPSQRLDAFGVEMAGLVAGAKRGGLTFAPEAGTQRLRDVINKNVTEEQFLNSVDAAIEAGWRHMKLYFMCGLPTETDDDLRGIGSLVERALAEARSKLPQNERNAVKFSISCAVFVPKPQTPFEFCGQIGREELGRRIGVIRESLPAKGVEFRWHDPGSSLVEAALARGGREMAAVVYNAWQAGAAFDAWSGKFSLETWEKAAEASHVSLEALAEREIGLSEPCCWDHISCGVERKYLEREYERALACETTSDCTFGKCTGCGACQALSCDIELSEARNG